MGRNLSQVSAQINDVTKEHDPCQRFPKLGFMGQEFVNIFALFLTQQYYRCVYECVVIKYMAVVRIQILGKV